MDDADGLILARREEEIRMKKGPNRGKDLARVKVDEGFNLNRELVSFIDFDPPHTHPLVQ